MKHCVWCDSEGCKQKADGFFYIHERCAEQLMDVNSDLHTIREILEGTHTRNKLGDDRIKLIFDFINDMEDFKRRWDNTIKIS